jgi:hypothetical protein
MKESTPIRIYQEVTSRLDNSERDNAIFGSAQHPLKIVVPYTTPGLTRAALRIAASYGDGFRNMVKLVYVHIVPYPLTLDQPDIDSEILAHQLIKEADGVSSPINVEIILARERNEALRSTVPAGSLVLLTTGKRWWKTSEQRLARLLSGSGCCVSLVQLRTSLLPGFLKLPFCQNPLRLIRRKVAGGNHA